MPDPGAAADDPDHRLRPPGRRAVQRRQHRHDAAGPAERRLADDQRDVDPARPPGPRSRASASAKINAAYSDGGPNLLIKTIQAATCSRTCRSTTSSTSTSAASRTWSTRSAASTPTSTTATTTTPRYTGYSSIDIQPGYQKLCGADALAFVRFRHTDSDIVRNARQQDFIRWAKDQYGVGQHDRQPRQAAADLRRAHRRPTTTCTPIDGLINLFNLVAFSAGHTIKQIKFPAQLAAVRHRRADAVLRDRRPGRRGGRVPRRS